ncbi:MAG: hydantoinase B/oxoprolinase family protein [Sedimenticolaceae bacterium]
MLNGRPLPAKCEGELRPGDRLRIETPGGGGYGKAKR